MAVTLLYDDDCGLCWWLLGVVLRWDRAQKVNALALNSPQAKTLLGSMSEDERMASWHLVSPTGEVSSAGAAIAPLMRILPWGSPIAAVADAFPRATARAYDWVARNRHSLGRRFGLQSCPIPDRAKDDARVG